MAWFDNGWGLSLIVFLPLAGALAVMRSEEHTSELQSH